VSSGTLRIGGPILMPHRRLVRDYGRQSGSAESTAYWAIDDRMSRLLTATSTPAMEIAPNNINYVHLKLKRLAERGILVETEQGLFTQPRP